MSADTHNDPPPEPVAVHEPARRGSIILVLLVAAALVAVAVALMTLGRAQAQPYILGLLAVLAMVGLFNLFAFAAGHHPLRRPHRRQSDHQPHRRSRL